jgi:hypothetical protein
VLSYDVDFKSDTHLPTYRLTTHILPVGQAFVSADQSAGRIHTQFCGQAGNACGNPHTKSCDLQAGWLSAAQRHVRCDSYNPGLELDPGAYQFVANCSSPTMVSSGTRDRRNHALNRGGRCMGDSGRGESFDDAAALVCRDHHARSAPRKRRASRHKTAGSRVSWLPDLGSNQGPTD